MKKKNQYIRLVLQALAWIIFVGLSIVAGGMIVNMIATLRYTPEGAKRFWTEVDLSAVYHHDVTAYITLTSLLCITAVLKAILFYLIVRMTYNRQWNLSRPFEGSVQKSLALIAWVALGIGLFAYWGERFAASLQEKGVQVPLLQDMHIDGADVWLFMGVILLIVNQLFRKGVEMQLENDLTV